jgi:hypothetical protein
MKNQERENLIKTLSEKLSFCKLTSDKKELIIRCPYCGDSSKTHNHGHFYIALDKENYFPYYCQKCNSSGIINRNFFKDINVVDYDLISSIEINNKEAKKKLKYRTSNIGGLKSLIYSNDEICLPSYDDRYDYDKLEYLENRYSFNIDIDKFICQYKTVFNLEAFLDINKIDYYNCSEYMFKELNNNYIGFLSNDKNFIIFRNIDKNCDKNKRYYMYNIYDNPEGKRFYTIETKVNILEPQVDIVLAEGPFDIIGIKEYFYNDINENTIFTSINGKGYGLVLNYFARLGFLNMNIKIYSDKDVNLTFYKNLINNYNILKNNKLTIYYNDIDKDYGTKIENIKIKRCSI